MKFNRRVTIAGYFQTSGYRNPKIGKFPGNNTRKLLQNNHKLLSRYVKWNAHFYFHHWLHSWLRQLSWWWRFSWTPAWIPLWWVLQPSPSPRAVPTPHTELQTSKESAHLCILLFIQFLETRVVKWMKIRKYTVLCFSFWSYNIP